MKSSSAAPPDNGVGARNAASASSRSRLLIASSSDRSIPGSIASGSIASAKGSAAGAGSAGRFSTLPRGGGQFLGVAECRDALGGARPNGFGLLRLDIVLDRRCRLRDVVAPVEANFFDRNFAARVEVQASEQCFNVLWRRLRLDVVLDRRRFRVGLGDCGEVVLGHLARRFAEEARVYGEFVIKINFRRLAIRWCFASIHVNDPSGLFPLWQAGVAKAF